MSARETTTFLRHFLYKQPFISNPRLVTDFFSVSTNVGNVDYDLRKYLIELN